MPTIFQMFEQCKENLSIAWVFKGRHHQGPSGLLHEIACALHPLVTTTEPPLGIRKK